MRFGLSLPFEVTAGFAAVALNPNPSFAGVALAI